MYSLKYNKSFCWFLLPIFKYLVNRNLGTYLFVPKIYYTFFNSMKPCIPCTYINYELLSNHVPFKNYKKSITVVINRKRYTAHEFQL